MNHTDAIAREVDAIVDRYGGRITGSVGMLQDIQGRYGHLPRAALLRLAGRLEVPVSQIYGLATFYRAFSLRPRGTHLVVVCMGTACHVRGAPRLLDEVSRRLAIEPGETTPDNQFTLEAVNCLGACALGPLMVVDGEYHGRMTARKVEAVLNRYGKGDETRSGKGKEGAAE